MNINREEIIWAAGLFEGEGSKVYDMGLGKYSWEVKDGVLCVKKRE